MGVALCDKLDFVLELQVGPMAHNQLMSLDTAFLARGKRAAPTTSRSTASCRCC